MSFRDRLIQWTPNFLVRLFARPYIAGNSLAMALSKADTLWKEAGLCSTLDLLGEGIQNLEDIEAEMQEYFRAFEALGSRSYVTLSFKPTQMGLALDAQRGQDNILRLLQKAKALGVAVTMDMEESRYVDPSLALYQRLRPEFPGFGMVLQSRLFRTKDDIRSLDGLQAHVRLCLGIYKEPPEIAYQDKPAMKENFLRLLRLLWEGGHFVGIATHDETLLRQSLALADEMKIPQDRYEVQMLLGVPRHAIQAEIRGRGCPVRLYVPYATEWRYAYAYAKRRLLENPQMALYVAGNLVRKFLDLFRRKPQREDKG